jgi:O-antigen ligase
MRRLAWALLLMATFAIPWAYSLDFGPPFGNFARIAVIAVVLALIPALFQVGRLRTPGPLQVLVVALLLWFCLSAFWSIDRIETLQHLRGYFQEFILVWLVWEMVDSPGDLGNVLRAYVAGAGVLAALTVGSFVLLAEGNRIRFAAEGQDPNDAARLLDLAFPLAALLFGSESRWPTRLLVTAYVPLGVLGVVLTASRSGFLDALIALTGSAILLFYNQRRAFFVSLCAVPVVVAAVWFTIPIATLQRLATIPDELMRRDFNQRADIWAAGWQTFIHAPLLGYGAGSFVAAAGLAPIDTAHNTALALLVEGGMAAFLIATAIGVTAVSCLLELTGPLRIALTTALLTWTIGSLVATVHENRATWLLLGTIAVAARLHAEQPEALARAFPVYLRASSTLLSAGVAQEKA